MKTENGIHRFPADGLVLVWQSDAEGRRNFVDDAWLALTGREGAPSVNERKNFSNWKLDVYPDDLPKVEGTLESHLATHQPFLIEYRLVKHNGKICWVTDVGSPRFNDDGSFCGFVGQCFVGDERRESRIANAQEIERRDPFLAILSHELRNPLTAIMLGINSANESNQVPEGLKQAWNIIERQTHHMSKLLDDLLDASRLTGSKIAFEKQLVDVMEIVREVVENSSLLPSHTQLELKLVGTEDPLLVIGDGNRLRQSFANLLDNAVKYTSPGGSVTFKLERDNDNAMVAISDTGMGIRKENLDHIFELFFQEYQSSNRSAGGIGVGLFLVKQILNQHGGSITAFSDGPGLGSKFVLSIPLASTSSDEQSESTS